MRRRDIPWGMDELQARGDRCGAYDVTSPIAQGLLALNATSDEAALIYKNWRDDVRRGETP